MYKGMSISDIVNDADGFAKDKADYVVDPINTVITDNKKLYVADIGDLPMTDTAWRQLASRTMSVKYMQRALEFEHEDGLDHIKEAYSFWKQEPKLRMMRTHDGIIRADLSNSYGRIDNNHIIDAVKPMLQAASKKDGMTLSQGHIDRDSLNIKFTLDKKFDLKPMKDRRIGDPVQLGIEISNDEIGGAKTYVGLFMYRLVCTNGMSGMPLRVGGYTRAHRGPALELGLQDNAPLPDVQEAILNASRRIAHSLKNENVLEMLHNMYAKAMATEAVVDPEALFRKLADHVDVLAEDRMTAKGIFLRNSARDGVTQWAVSQALTEVGNTCPTFQRAKSMEVAGGKILSMQPRAWATLAKTTEEMLAQDAD